MTDNKLIHLLQFRWESLKFVSLKLQEKTEKTTGGNYFSLCLRCKKLIFIDQTMTLPRTSLINKVWHNACHYYLCFKINKNSRLKKSTFMGSLGTCIARDCFCGQEISTKAQDTEETIAWGNVALLQGNLLKSQKWIPDVLSYTSSYLKKPFSFTALPHWLLDFLTQFSFLPIKFNILYLAISLLTV